MSQKQSKNSLRSSELSVSSIVKMDRVINGVFRMIFGHENTTSGIKDNWCNRIDEREL